MNKYNDKLINDYINGNDIEGYTLDELENNFDFMIQVIEKSNDKNIYHLCSDELKKDYSLVKYIIIKFNNDIDFIDKVVEHYLKNTEDDAYKMEIIHLMCQFTKNVNNDIYQKYELIRDIKYQTIMVIIEGIKEEIEDDDYLLSEIGKGFFYIYERFNHSKVTLQYFAKRLMAEIMTSEEINLEELIHNQFNSYEELEEYGIRKYLLELIREQDYHLASYAIVHSRTLSPFLIEIKRLQNTWDKYLMHKEKEKYENILSSVEVYVHQKLCHTTLNEEMVLCYLGKLLGIEDIIKKILEMTSEEYNELKKDTYRRIDSSIISLETSKDLIKIKQILIDTLNLNFNEKEKRSQNKKILKLINYKKIPKI